MTRKLLAFMAGMAMALSFLAVQPATPAAQPVSADQRACVDLPPEYYHTGGWASSSTTTRKAVESTIDLGQLLACAGSDIAKSVSVWISLEPRWASDCPNPTLCIMQYGLISCYSANPLEAGLCFNHDPADIVFFVANGGCALWEHPVAQAAPPYNGTSAPVKLKILMGSSAFYFYVNDVQQFSVPFSDSGISCWATKTLMAGFFGEKHDRDDTFGTMTNPTKFSGMRYKTAIAGSAPWYPYSPTFCDRIMPASGDHFVLCGTPSAGSMHMWD